MRKRKIRKDEVRQEVVSLVCHHLSVKLKDVSMGSNFVNDLGADSLDQVELIMAFEEKFDIEIPDEDTVKITTVGEAVEYVKERVR